ncbi:MAG: methionine ABC transporter permease [Varibaculum cambriense]|nr:methionine ABC transporter permease [Varibaculum cambriense]MDU5246995.1 methionine ABC transporter permease [Varibaculum cambriense]MDU5268687.1 methionine ABC transporter permease [Varibaculum cambriense]MDU6680389.1 methionine ABC transporter permease [Varibaculum cambriense]
MPLAADDSGRWFSNPVITNNLLDATLETIYMSLWSGFFSILLGLPIGLLLVATAPAGLLSASKVARVLYAVLGFIVNVGRSLPFVILMISIIPFTRLLVGTSLGWKAAVVPLTLAAAPFFARLVESNVQGVESGKLEAAKMAGASNWQIMLGVQVREALPSLIQSITVTLISLIGYGAMAGTLGTGGLGALAMNYGYTRFMGDVMLIVVIDILLIVVIVQWVGDMLSRLVDHR